MEIDLFQALHNLVQSTGFLTLTIQQGIMLLISLVLLYLAIVKGFEPMLLIPIAFGMLLANIPHAGMMASPTVEIDAVTGKEKSVVGGLLWYLYQGVKFGIYPPLIFMGVGAMTDFGPLIANPKTLLLGAAAQLGIFSTFIGALHLGFTPQEASAIGIIGGADGPTAIFVTSKLAPHLLGAIAIAAYSYMALVPIIQPPIMRLLTTRKMRLVVMGQLRKVSKTERIIFPIFVTLICTLMLPDATPLVGMLMLGNLFRESGVVPRLSDTSQNALINMLTIFLGVTVGATANAENFITVQTISIVVLGLLAFCIGTAGGVLFGVVMYFATGGKVNPLIGSAGVSAVPMAARVSQVVGQRENPRNYLLMHAMGPNVAGVIGSAVAAGVLLSLFKG